MLGLGGDDMTATELSQKMRRILGRAGQWRARRLVSIVFLCTVLWDTGDMSESVDARSESLNETADSVVWGWDTSIFVICKFKAWQICVVFVSLSTLGDIVCLNRNKVARYLLHLLPYYPLVVSKLWAYFSPFNPSDHANSWNDAKILHVLDCIDYILLFIKYCSVFCAKCSHGSLICPCRLTVPSLCSGSG